MGIEKLVDVSILGHQSKKKSTLDALHNLGIMHISEIKKSKFDLKRDGSLDVSENISQSLLELRWIKEQLSPFLNKKVSINNLFSEKKCDVVLNKAKQIKNLLHAKVSELVDKFNSNSKKIDELLKAKSFLGSIPFPIDSNASLSNSITFTFLINQKEDSQLDIEDVLSKYLKKISVFGNGSTYLVHGLIQDKYSIEKCLKENDFNILKVPEAVSSHNFKLAKINNTLKLVKRDNIKVVSALKNIAQLHFEEVIKVESDLIIFHERYTRSTSFLSSSNMFYLEGFVSKKDLKLVKKVAEKNKLHIHLETPNKAPTKIKNFIYVKHFDFITKMFGLPSYNGIDPTFYLSIFIPFFFGFMFSDVGYGILLTIISVVMLAFSKPKTRILLDAGVVLLFCSISTIVFGLLFGSFFGALIKITPVLFDPFANAKTVLIAALVIGIIHLNLGILLSVIQKIKDRAFKDLIIGDFALVLLQVAGVLLFMGAKPVGMILLGLSVVLFIIKSSLMGLLEISGFVGTWLSYARLLALSLATGGIALGINIMAEQLNSVSLFGPLLFILFILIGHTFNFAMNVLGSSIHAVRLHYIEFFSQFYEAEGSPFKPFTTKKVKDTF